MNFELKSFGRSGLRLESREDTLAIRLGPRGDDRLRSPREQEAIVAKLPPEFQKGRSLGPLRLLDGLAPGEVKRLARQVVEEMPDQVGHVTQAIVDADAKKPAPMVPTGTINIRIDRGASSADDILRSIRRIAEPAGCSVTVREDGVVVVSQPGERRWPEVPSAIELAVELETVRGTRHVEPDFAVPLSSLPDAGAPPACATVKDWHLGVPPALASSFHHSNVRDAWNSLESVGRPKHGSPSITTAILDFGFDLGHPDFLNPGPPALLDFLGEPPPADLVDHGTAVAGLVFASPGATEAHGVAPGCTPLCVTCGQWFSDSTIEMWLRTARLRGASVLNCSWMCEASHWVMSVELEEAISRTVRLGRGGWGMVVVFAAGNDARPVAGHPGYRNDLPCHPEVLGVGAIDRNGARADYSNVGSEISLFAPSSGSGIGLLTTGGGGAYCGFGGTSGAAPIVAGVAALVMTANMALCGQCVREVLRDTARALPDCTLPATPGATYPLRLVDAEAAVKEAMQRTCTHPRAISV